jgi:Lipocalin-like domain
MTRGLLVTILALTLGAAADELDAPKGASIVGTWKLLSASASTADGARNDRPYGERPSGMLIYTADGRMMAVISHSGRKPLSGDRIGAPADERANAFASFLAYGGRYSLRGDTVVHHVEVASVENWVNTDLVRLLTIDGNRMTLRTPPLSRLAARCRRSSWRKSG